MRVLAGVGSTGRGIGRVVQINETRGVAVHGETEFADGIHIKFGEEVAGGGDEVRAARSALRGEGEGPRIGEKLPAFAWLRISSAEVQVEEFVRARA